jgi:hypothetical protein
VSEDDILKAAKANGVKDMSTLLYYISVKDYDAAMGLIWSYAED